MTDPYHPLAEVLTDLFEAVDAGNTVLGTEELAALEEVRRRWEACPESHAFEEGGPVTEDGDHCAVCGGNYLMTAVYHQEPR